MLHTVYFSATGTTKKVIETLAGQFDCECTAHDITLDVQDSVVLNGDDLLIVGAPVYSGRIPAIEAERLNKFTGNGTPAVIVAVYGNREYDDALVEMQDLMSARGFKVVAGAAFLAQHSIFPIVAAGRPDKEDLLKIAAFGRTLAEKLASVENVDAFCELEFKGNRPYKEANKPALKPTTDETCSMCGVCAAQCPVGAIDEDSLATDVEKCISCARCIAVCPQNARNFRGEMYQMAGAKFAQAFSARKEPETYIVATL